MKKSKKYKFLAVFAVIFTVAIIITRVDYSQEAHQSTKVSEQNTQTVVDKQTGTGFEKVTLTINNVEDIDGQIEDYMRGQFPIISDNEIQVIQGSKEVSKKLVNDTLGDVDVYLSFSVPKHYMEAHPVMLWELNLPEFSSGFTIYNMIYVDRCLAKCNRQAKHKNCTGHYNIFRLRNWPSGKIG